jgi:L-lactate dehydrogenase complex protein LldG
MNISASKENILKKIRKALTQTTPIPFPGSEGTTSVFIPGKEEMEIEFGEHFTKLLGKFAYCADVTELKLQLEALFTTNKWKNIVCREEELRSFLPAIVMNGYDDLENADAAVTSCEALVARTGSIVLSSAGKSGRATSVYAAIHICIAYTDQLVYDVKDGLQLIRERYAGRIPSLVTFATGPSRTADIEKTLVVGVHGPKEVYVFLVERNNEF